MDDFITERKNENKKFETFEILDMSKQILNGLGHLHKIGIVHFDIKPKYKLYNPNILQYMYYKNYD